MKRSTTGSGGRVIPMRGAANRPPAGPCPTDEELLAARGCQVLVGLARSGERERLRAAVDMLEGLEGVGRRRAGSP